MTALLQDIRYGFRMVMRNPGFTAVVVLVLALGIGSNTMVFSIVNAVLLRPLPYNNPEELVMVWGANQNTGQSKMWVSAPDFADWAQNQGCFGHFAAYETTDVAIRTAEGLTSMSAVCFSGDIFSVIGTEMLLGRTFALGTGREREDTVATISHRMWQNHMGGDPNVIGRNLFLNDKLHTIVGVLPEDFRFFYEGGFWVPNVWIPLSLTQDSQKNSRGNHYLQAIGRLREGVTLSQAQKKMELIAGQLALTYPETNAGKTVRLQSLHEHVLGDARPTLLILSVAVVLVLFVACANVGNLLLARAVQHEEEMAIRAALGAGRARVIKQLLVESCLLTLLGGVCGLLVTIWGLKGILALSPWNIPRIQEICVDANVFLFTLAMSVIIGVIFGLYPAIRVLRVDLIGILGAQGRGSTWNVRQHWARSTLVVVETALTLVLFVGAGLLIRSFTNLHNPDLGYESKNLILAEIHPPVEQVSAALQEITDRVASLPGVAQVSMSNVTPFYQSSRSPIYIAGKTENMPPSSLWIDRESVGSNHLKNLGIAVLQGRDFTIQDALSNMPVTIIDEILARRFFPDEDPVGQRLKIGWCDSDSPWLTIVGVVTDTKPSPFSQESYGKLYLPLVQFEGHSVVLWVRCTSDPTGLVASVQQVLKQALGGEIPEVTLLSERLRSLFSTPGFIMKVIGIFATLSMIMAAVGLYGLVTYSVNQCTREIGIRIALGAQRWQIFHTVLHKGLLLSAVGVGVGSVVALGATRCLCGLLVDITSADPLTFFLSGLLLLAVTALACFVPARRAAKIDPIETLRYE